jgi:hypothetical protein
MRENMTNLLSFLIQQVAHASARRDQTDWIEHERRAVELDTIGQRQFEAVMAAEDIVGREADSICSVFSCSCSSCPTRQQLACRSSAGVLLKPSGVARETEGEGVHLIGPFAKSDVYDLRAREQTEDLAALSADGGMIEARAFVLTYHPVPAELVALDREVGPNYDEVVVRPVVRSTLRRIIAGYRAEVP